MFPKYNNKWSLEITVCRWEKSLATTVRQQNLPVVCIKGANLSANTQ